MSTVGAPPSSRESVTSRRHVCCFDRDGKREVGYWTARDHWGRGIATEAVFRFLADVPERPLYAGASAGNAGSRTLRETLLRETPDLDC